MSGGDDVLAMTDGGHDDAVESAGQSAPLTLPPLMISALMVTKADLIAALRVYLPNLSDIEAIDDGRFLLSVAEPQAEHGGEQ